MASKASSKNIRSTSSKDEGKQNAPDIKAEIVHPSSLLSPRDVRQIMFWLGAFTLLVVFLYIFSSILLPFIAGMALAYMLDPVADKLEAIGTSRLMATVIILLSFVVIFSAVIVIFVPILASQFAGLAERVPGYIVSIQTGIENTKHQWLRDLAGNSAESLEKNINSVIQQGAGWATKVLASIWTSGKAVLNVVSLLVITPIVAFYLLLDWDRMVARIDSWLPRDHKTDLEDIARDMNKAIAGFVRGQGSVCLILGIFYAVGLSLAGLNFGLLIGMVAGLISFIPFVGSIIGMILAVGVALFQFWPDYAWIALIFGIFALGQFLEGNFLQPKMVGESVGLHPVWLMFSLSAFGVLLGFAGLLIAVPVAAAIAVLVRFALNKYLQSPFYKGEHFKPEET